jgi:hypothetical protein
MRRPRAIVSPSTVPSDRRLDNRAGYDRRWSVFNELGTVTISSYDPLSGTGNRRAVALAGRGAIATVSKTEQPTTRRVRTIGSCKTIDHLISSRR